MSQLLLPRHAVGTAQLLLAAEAAGWLCQAVVIAIHVTAYNIWIFSESAINTLDGVLACCEGSRQCSRCMFQLLCHCLQSCTAGCIDKLQMLGRVSSALAAASIQPSGCVGEVLSHLRLGVVCIWFVVSTVALLHYCSTVRGALGVAHIILHACSAVSSSSSSYYPFKP
ncbi:hypothetical protein COO60DRAFT_1533445 [Scenedesmus sp. NREL 46B-D3]|nr:hypothetical protein COO60DRAFT_1533445 [Scenedesmus sp. NREL 46B-D3]